MPVLVQLLKMVIFDVVEILEEFLIVDGLSNARLSIKSVRIRFSFVI